ncbi:hypothetical protein [Polaromonas sp.]|uniref:hypothetical protein n=1 Tax=Polaromonas sp. TaxID=1869339 RepID=UPI0025F27FE5|nr:hypothetical protein [Polaromonas sp.]
MYKNHELNAVDKRTGQVALTVWVGFLAACLLEGLVFSLVDPGEVHWPGRMPQPTRLGIYTMAFFCFWLIGMAAAGAALWLSASPGDVNDTVAD